MRHGLARRGIMGKRVLLFLLIFLVTACASDPLTQINFSTRESFRATEFAASGTARTIALLTAMEGKDGNGSEYRRLLADFIEESIRTDRPDFNITPYWEGLNTINSTGLTGDYAAMFTQYASTGILNSAALKKLGGALKVDYVIQPRLVNFQQKQSNRFSALGLTIFKTHESEIKIYIEMWDVKTGRLVWIGLSEANLASEKFRARPIPFEAVARVAVQNLIKKIP